MSDVPCEPNKASRNAIIVVPSNLAGIILVFVTLDKDFVPEKEQKENADILGNTFKVIIIIIIYYGLSMHRHGSCD